MLQPVRINKNNKEGIAFSIFSGENFQHLEVLEFQAYICMEVLDVVNHFYPIYFSIICPSNKKEECISMNLWVAFMHNYFNCKNRKRDMTQ